MLRWHSKVLGGVLLSVLCGGVLAVEPPILKYVEPSEGSRIDEDSAFAIVFDQAVKPESLSKRASCLVEGIGEQIPVRLLSEDEREQLFATSALSWLVRSVEEEDRQNGVVTQQLVGHSAIHPPKSSDRIALLQCTRQLPTNAKVTVTIAPGLEGSNGEVTSKSFAFNYQVREPFKASFSCDRINAKTACSPLGKLWVSFNSAVPKSQADQVKVLVDGKIIKPMSEEAGEDNLVYSLTFDGTFTPKADIQVNLPQNIKDDTGRVLANADKFPLKTHFDAYPPLLKFATGNFGIIESYAHAKAGVSLNENPALIPLTVRNVEKKLATRGLYQAGTVTELAIQDDAQVRKWLGLVPQLSNGTLSKRNFSRLLDGLETQYREDEEELDVRNLSALAKQKGSRQYTLPSLRNVSDETEVIGLPVRAPGFYVFEARSPMLGAQLTQNEQPMYVRTAVLVTNMGVHLKTSDKGALVWVTRLDDAQVIPNAEVRLSDCHNRDIATGKTDENGVFRFEGKLPSLSQCEERYAYMASVRLAADNPMSYGVADYAFAFSDWDRGIENWQFNVDNSSYYANDESRLLIHPVLGRTLLRAGEKVHIKHFMRLQTDNGIASLSPENKNLPNKVVFSIDALDEEVGLPLTWVTAPNGSVYAETVWTIPKTAKNGVYTIRYRENDKAVKTLNPEVHFQVEEFKVPFLKGNIQVSSNNQQGNVLINPQNMMATIQLSYLSGGAAAELPVDVSAMLVPSTFSVKDMDNTVFGDDSSDNTERKVFLNKKKVVLDINGHAQLDITDIPDFKGSADIVVEASFMDPNGQIQTITQTVPVVSSGVMVGLRGESYAEAGKQYIAQVVAVDAMGQPQANVEVSVKAVQERMNVVRKRLVGGFYAVDTHTTEEDMGTLCQGKTDAQGVLNCALDWSTTGELALTAQAHDNQGNFHTTRQTVWVYKGFNWYAGNDTDRVDVVADKKSYQAGEEATFDVKIPFREATALVSVEREGVLDYQVVHFAKNSSTFKLKVKPEWAPNVFVNVLSIRGRLRDGMNDAGEAWVKDDTQAHGASTLIDLAKPSFRLGVAKIKVDNPNTRMQVALNLDKSVYQIRDTAKVHISAKRANGDKAAQANVVLFVVDKALLELAKNNTDDVLAAMWPERPWSVHTATAQGEVVGRRHYGRKAIPAGGGGGLAPTRELFDTLVFWKANTVLDANGEADIEFKLNDSISQFEVVAVVDDGDTVFGAQKTTFASKQDLQIISGLPSLIRDTDKFDAVITLHNSAEKDMTVAVKGSIKKDGVLIQELPEKQVTLYAGRSNRAVWSIDPLSLSDNEAHQKLDWYFEAKEVVATEEVNDVTSENKELKTKEPASATKVVAQLAQDKIHVTQQLIPYVPVTVRQSQLLKVPADGNGAQLSVQPPTRAMSINNTIRGGIQVQIQKSLSASLNGVKRYFAEYPYSCFEQRASVAMGLQDSYAWQRLMQEVNNYMDDEGFVRYYPSSRLDGSPLLNAYILSISADAKALGWSFDIPDSAQERMLESLTNIVLGKVKQERDWIPVHDKTDYNLTLLAALARYHRVTESMMEAYPLTAGYSEAGLVNLYIIHQSLHGAQRETILANLRQRILDKMVRQSDRLVFKNATALNELWWLMDDSKSIHAKLLLAVASSPSWEKDVPALVQGLIASQLKGQWGMTTNNLLGSLAIHTFSQYFEKVPAEGEINVSLKDQDHDVAQQWNGLSLNQSITIPWVSKQSADMQIKLIGKGNAWATVSSLAAVDPAENSFAGYRVDKLIEPISRRIAGQWSVGDVYRVHLRITSEAPMNWVVVNDPIPSGATILGSGLGRDSVVSGQLDEKLEEGSDEYSSYVEPSFIERKADVYRAYYRFVDKGELTLEYTVRLNNVGKFALPATRVEAMYAPSVFGEAVNNDIQVKAP